MLPVEQLSYYSDPVKLWAGELSHLAWCGGMYADKVRFSSVQDFRGEAWHMRQYLPLVSVGVSWKRIYKHVGNEFTNNRTFGTALSYCHFHQWGKEQEIVKICR